MYRVNYIKINDISILKNEWRRLESGSDMTYFQTYNWFQSIISSIPRDSRSYEARFVVLSDEISVKIIAPIWVVKHTFRFINKKGIYLLGCCGWSDYLNFIYSDVTEAELVYLLNDISNHYDIYRFDFADLPEDCQLYKTIIKAYLIKLDNVTKCIDLRLPNSFNEYRLQLSKNFKQNLRTAANRLSKLGLEISYNFDDATVDKQQCQKIREYRLPKKDGNYSFIRRCKIAIVEHLRFHFNYDLPFYADIDSHIMTAYIGGELAAYFNYGIDVYKNNVVLMAVGTNEKFTRYSPGILLISEYIRFHIENTEIRVIDFTRGNEKYKYSLGGREHFNHNVVFNIY